VILWEQDNRFQMVPTDGRELPKDLEPTWMGTSVGRWDGDTLVITTAGFNGRTWLDTAQHPHSDALKLTIRMTRPDFDHLNWEITIEDPKYYQKPIKNARRADGEGHRALRVFVRREQSLRGRQVRRGGRAKVGWGQTPGYFLTYFFSARGPTSAP
jgi:hypothetical protein